MEAPEPVAFVQFLLKSPAELRATIVVAAPKQFVETGMVVRMEKSFGRPHGEFARMMGLQPEPLLPGGGQEGPKATDTAVGGFLEATGVFQIPEERTGRLYRPSLPRAAPPVPPTAPPESPAFPADLYRPGEATRMFQVRTWLEATLWVKPPEKKDD